MGREIKHVALDFTWPVGQIWEGYLNPHYRKCPTCSGACLTPARQWLEAIVSCLLLAGEDSRYPDRPLHPFLRSFAQRPDVRPSAELADLTSGLAGRRIGKGIIGHDAIDRYSAVKKVILAAGLPETWGWCPTCEGDGIDPAVKEAHDAWKQTEPPEGPGWQVWETVSEGSPVSPVLETREALVDWLVDVQRYSRDAAEAFTQAGWVPSMVVTGGQMYRNIESAVLR